MARAMMTNLLMSIVAATMLAQLALAVDHNVGAPNGGWDTSTDLQTWTSSQTFTVGDSIVFTYTPNHDVLEVSKDNYDSCSTSGPIRTSTRSPTTIALSDAGSRYFICGTAGHCDQGMKVEIKTEAAASTPTTPTTPSTPSTPSTPTTPESSSPDTPSPPASTTPGTPTPARPSPSSAETVKMTAVSMVGLGFMMMI